VAITCFLDIVTRNHAALKKKSTLTFAPWLLFQRRLFFGNFNLFIVCMCDPISDKVVEGGRYQKTNIALFKSSMKSVSARKSFLYLPELH
jgi:hypothetical protein